MEDVRSDRGRSRPRDVLPSISHCKGQSTRERNREMGDGQKTGTRGHQDGPLIKHHKRRIVNALAHLGLWLAAYNGQRVLR